LTILTENTDKVIDKATDKVIDTENLHKVVESVARNKVGQNLAWKWLRSNWDQVLGQYKSEEASVMGNMMTACTETFNSESELKELEEFYTKNVNKLEPGKRATENAIKKTKGNIEWMKKNYQQIVDWLNEKNREAPVY
jgi:aminopeptidase N